MMPSLRLSPFCRAALAGWTLLAAPSTWAVDIGQLTTQLTATERELRREASYHLLQLGPAAKPALPDLIKALDDTDKQVWSNAIAAIAAIGPDAVEAVPKLLEGMDSRKGRGMRPRDKAQTLFRSAYALTCIGQGAKPQLLAALQAEDRGLRAGAAKALGGMGVAAREAVPALIENLKIDDDDLRSAVAEALGQIGPEAVKPLGEALGQDSVILRQGCAMALASIGKASAPAGEQLLTTLAKETAPSARIILLTALPKIGLPPEKITPPLMAALRDDKEDIRHAATNAILLIRPAAKTVVPALIPLLKDPSQSQQAAYVLGRFGAEARAAVPELIAAAQKQSPPPPAITEALSQIGAPSVAPLLVVVEKIQPASLAREHWAVQTLQAIGPSALPALQKGLASPSAGVRLAALYALNNLGTDAREARADVLKLSGDAEPLVRATVLSVLVALDASPQKLLEKIEAATRDPQPAVRAGAANAAAALGADAAPIAPQITILLDDRDAAVRVAALQAISKLGGDQSALVEKLLARLDDPATRVAAIEALAKANPGAALPRLLALYPNADRVTKIAALTALAGAGEPALPTLESASKDGDAGVRAAALRALGKSQPNGEKLVGVLTPALKDGDMGVRHAALQSLAPLGERQADKAVPALPALVDLIANETDRNIALETLRSLRVRDLGVLTIALDSPAQDARAWAAERAGRIGAQARPLRPKLETMLNSGNDTDRRAARRALEQMGK